MKAIAAVLAGALLLGGCTYQVRHAGDDRFLHAPALWEPGRTSVRDVVQELGAPDVIRWSLGRLVFIYRAQRQVSSGLALSFYLKLFSREQKRAEDGTLLLAFDDDDRLLYVGKSDEPRSDLTGDLGLR